MKGYYIRDVASGKIYDTVSAAAAALCTRSACISRALSDGYHIKDRALIKYDATTHRQLSSDITKRSAGEKIVEDYHLANEDYYAQRQRRINAKTKRDADNKRNTKRVQKTWRDITLFGDVK